MPSSPPELTARVTRALFRGRYFDDSHFGALVRGGRVLDALDYFADCVDGREGAGTEAPWWRLYVALCIRAFVDSMASKRGHAFLKARARLLARAPAGTPVLAQLDAIIRDPDALYVNGKPALQTLDDNALLALAHSVPLTPRKNAATAMSSLGLTQVVGAAIDVRNNMQTSGGKRRRCGGEGGRPRRPQPREERLGRRARRAQAGARASRP